VQVVGTNATLDWLYSNAVGGVKVDVADEDYERALEVLESVDGPR
jgi:hypothetical protein